MKRLILVAVVLAAVSFVSPGGEEAPLAIHFIDVGYGDAILIESPPGSETAQTGMSVLPTGRGETSS